MEAIWRDYYYSVAATQAWFEVYAGSRLLYAGKAVARPGASSVAIRLNDIVADYLSSSLSDYESGMTEQSDVVRVFSVRHKVSQGDAWSAAQSVTFVNDWSYESDFDAERTGLLSDPITGEIDRRQPLWLSYAKEGRLIVNNGVASQVTFTGAGTYKVSQAGAQNDSVVVSADGMTRTYAILPPCYSYALYYVNAFGGWDSLLMKGAATLTEDYDRKAIDTDYDNRDREARGRRDYAAGIVRRWSLHTGWLDEDASSRMGQLMGSVEVLLYDIAEDAFIPVVLTGSSWERKDYDNSRSAAIDYVIEVSEAQARTRR